MLFDKLFLQAAEGKFAQSAALKPLSFLWSVGAGIKNWLYDRNVLPIHHLSSCVVSVGNLVAGGSGKTPLVYLLASQFAAQEQVAILSRGYLAKQSHLRLGDELTMLSKMLPQVIPFAGKDRIANGRKAIRQGARLIILDDGFQYRRLHRDFDLVIVDATNPFGFGDFIPRGLLRDPPQRLKDAHAVFVNGACSNEWIDSLRRWTKAPVIVLQPQCERFCDLNGCTVSRPTIQKVGAFCAIGQPQRFLQTLSLANVEVVNHWFLKDHEKPSLAQLEQFARKCQQLGAASLVCTHKDAVKIDFNSKILPIYYLEMQFKIISGMKDWQSLVESIRQKNNW